jgi:hypothetical protein
MYYKCLLVYDYIYMHYCCLNVYRASGFGFALGHGNLRTGPGDLSVLSQSSVKFVSNFGAAWIDKVSSWCPPWPHLLATMSIFCQSLRARLVSCFLHKMTGKFHEPP